MAERQLTITARDGYRLAATLYSPERVEPRDTLAVINGAIGVGRRYYRFYARFLARRGFHVVTYDYRGVGDSLDSDWKGAAPGLQDWGEQDLAGVIDWACREYPQHRIVCIGHSTGGALLGLANNNAQVWAQLGISAPSAYWGDFRYRDWPRLLFYGYLLVPMVALLLGRFPSHQVDYSEDLPRGLAWSWARWSRSPAFVVDRRGQPIREHFHGYRGRLRFYVLDDDRSHAPASAVRALAGYFVNADVQILHVSAQDFGVEAIGHYGFFRPDMPEQAWQQSVDWLLAAVHSRLRQSID